MWLVVGVDREQRADTMAWQLRTNELGDATPDVSLERTSSTFE
jgi:hypothetical protein